MRWGVEFHPDYELEFDLLSERQKEELAATLTLPEAYGPTLGRPRADTLNGSKIANLKELRVSVGNEVWRIAYAFDPRRHGIILYGGDKAGQNERRFYKDLIRIAEARYADHLKRLKDAEKKEEDQ